MMDNILVTGATGFIGTNLTRALLSRGYKVHILCRPSSNIWRLEDIKDKIILHHIDILDKASLNSTSEKIFPSYIFHLAAYGAYPRRQTDSKKIHDINVTGTANLLEATKSIPYKCFINTGSSSEYGPSSLPMKETDKLYPNTDYGISKATATLLCQKFAQDNQKPVITLRPFAVYGYYEEAFRLIPHLILNCLRGDDVELSSGEQKRDFVFIEDMVDAYIKAMSCDSKEGIVLNVGTGLDIPVREVAELVKSLAGSSSSLQFGKKEKALFETSSSWKADLSTVKKSINWKPKTSLKEGLKKTIAWFRENAHLYK